MGETTPEEERRLIAWRSASPENDAHARSLAAIWELSGKARTAADGVRPTARAIIDRASRIEPPTGRRTERGPRHRAGRWLLAGSVIAAGLASLLLLPSDDLPPAPTDAVQTILASESRTVQLTDGSAVHLAAGATLRFDPTEPRNVWLVGRAYFGVSADPRNPFFVHTPAGVTRVLGTRFDVRADSSELRVVVVEGVVRVQTDRGDVEVGYGQQTRAVRDSVPTVAPADPDAVTGWLERVFIFQATPLSEVARELSRRFDRRIEIADPRLRDRTVTAVFADRGLDEILPALCRAVEAQCAEADGVVVVTLRNPPSNR